MPTGLQKLPIEVQFKGGLTEKIHEDMSAPEGLYRLENVELDKVGAFTRRRGFEVMTTAIINSGSTSGDPLKVAGREAEIFKITEDVGALGSGGGSGASGGNVFCYSPEADGWKNIGKISTVTLERFSGLNSAQVNIKTLDCGYCSHVDNGKFIVLSYTVGEFNSSNQGVYMAVYDYTSRAMILEPTDIDPGATFNGKLQVVSVGQYCVTIMRGSSITTDTFGVIYDASNNARSSPVTIYSASAFGRSDIWCAGSDGAFLYLASWDGADVKIERFSVTGTTIVSQGSATTAEAGVSTNNIWMAIAGTTIHISWNLFGTGIKYWSATTAPASLSTPIVVSVNNDILSKTYVAPVSATEAVIFWNRVGTATEDYTVSWRWIKLATTAPAARANEHRVQGIQVGSNPFVYNNRVFVPVVGCMFGTAPAWETDTVVPSTAGLSNFGFCLCEVNSISSEEDVAGGNQYLTMLPVGTWSRDVSRYSLPGLSAFSPFEERFVATVRQTRQADTFTIERRGQLYPTAHTTSVWSLDITRIKFNDPKRYQHAEAGGATTLACALPYTYDGMNSHECGYVFRPAIASVEEISPGSGDWDAGEVALFKAVYEWEDVRGARWFSDSSYTARFEVTVDNSVLRMRVRPPVITAKVMGGSGFSGRIRINMYRADQNAPDDFKLFASTAFMIFDGSGNPITTLGIFDDAGTADLLSNEKSYLTGGELDNACAPPCVSLVQHRDRLFCIDTENNKLWYTKPFSRDRGLEWSRYQTLALPSKGTALASIEGALIVCCENQILVLEGQGPAVTGLPPDAYGRLSVLTQDQGCPEVNGIWRIPSGAIFKSQQGFWGIGGSLGMTYVGAAVEDIGKRMDRVVDGQLDEVMGCLRIMTYISLDAFETPGRVHSSLNYWYDTGRWSVDWHRTDEVETLVTTLAHRGDYYIGGSAGLMKRSDTRFLDNDEVPANAYVASVRTGRYRLDSLAAFKRLWRLLVNLVARDGIDPLMDLIVKVETQGPMDAAVSETIQTFSGAELQGATPKTLRMHVKYQKGQSFRFTLTETPNVDTLLAVDNGPPGYKFLGLGLELGMKRGAAKLPGVRST